MRPTEWLSVAAPGASGARPGKQGRVAMLQRFLGKTILLLSRPLDMKLQYSKINVVVDHTEVVTI